MNIQITPSTPPDAQHLTQAATLLMLSHFEPHEIGRINPEEVKVYPERPSHRHTRIMMYLAATTLCAHINHTLTADSGMNARWEEAYKQHYQPGSASGASAALQDSSRQIVREQQIRDANRWLDDNQHLIKEAALILANHPAQDWDTRIREIMPRVTPMKEIL